MKPFPALTPPLNIVLVQPKIPPNTGNIARLCAATKSHLILLGELGFELSDRTLKRAGLDYWSYVSWEHILDHEAFFNALPKNNAFLFTTHSQRSYTQGNIKAGDYLFFGSETTGLPKPWLHQHEPHCFTLPMMQPQVRSLNLSNAVAIVLYHALSQNLKF